MSLIHLRPYIVSAYRKKNKISAIDILRKWIYMYNQCKQRNVNLVGFSSDGDSRYLKAMQLSLGFFARAPNVDLSSGNDKLLSIDIPSNLKFSFL
jgi:hypothetical protein